MVVVDSDSVEHHHTNRMTQVEAKSALEQFIEGQVSPHLVSDERILHTGYLITDLQASSPVGVIVAGLGLRACFIAVSQTRAFFLWSKPGRIGAFKPLLECGNVQIVDRSQIAAKIKRSALFSRSLWLSLSGDVIALRLKRKVRDLPDQAQMIDALCVRTMV
jgi:hypothetical protein